MKNIANPWFSDALLATALFAELPNFRWDTPVSTVLDKYPGAMRNWCCYFNGVNIFGRDSLEIYTEPIEKGDYDRHTFLFMKKRLVEVELKFRTDSVTLNNFEQKVVEPLKKKFGSKKFYEGTQDDKTKHNQYYLWRTKTDVILAMYGHFKKVNPNNLDWVKVCYYKKEFYDFKNQGKSSLVGEGEWKVFY